MHQHTNDALKHLKMVCILLLAITSLTVSIIQEAKAAVMPGGNGGWLVVASRPNASEAVNVARGYANRFP